uniref:hypothetical protein n=1 Tax=Jatrophihabitans lederbergiae TaxID=3075547 RepID=UPI0037BE347C
MSPDLISRVTDAVLEELQEWQSRTLGRVWPAGLPKHFRAGRSPFGARMAKTSTGQSLKFWLTVLPDKAEFSDTAAWQRATGLPDARWRRICGCSSPSRPH